MRKKYENVCKNNNFFSRKFAESNKRVEIERKEKRRKEKEREEKRRNRKERKGKRSE